MRIKARLLGGPAEEFEVGAVITAEGVIQTCPGSNGDPRAPIGILRARCSACEWEGGASDLTPDGTIPEHARMVAP